MKILYFHQHFSTPKGATGTRSYEFSRALITRGHEVTVVCGSYWIADSGLKCPFNHGVREGCVDGINVIELQLSYSNSDGFLQRAMLFLKYSVAGIKLALSLDYDLVFATTTPLTAGIPGIFAKLIRRKPFIFEVRDLWPELPKAMGVIKNPLVLKLMGILETVSYRIADKCVALAPGIADGITQKAPEKEVIIIPNGSDAIRLTKVECAQSQKLIAAFSGAHGIANGLDAILNAALELLNMGEEGIEIQFIGDGKMKAGLIQRVERENITNCFFLDPMPKVELFKYLNESVHVGLMVLDNVPAFYNGTSPNKFFDYLSIGLPVLNNYPGWLANLIEANNCGIVVKAGDAKEFARALVEYRDDPVKRVQNGKNSKLLSEKQFSRGKLADKFIEYIESA
jgi:glycosyltransferase involved in cell wall biosynthesis